MSSSFVSISDTHFSGDFVRSSGNHTCLLTDTRSNARTGRSRFIEIRKKADGTRSAVLEGYTPDGKVYSIRTSLDSEGPFDGMYRAWVFDGSGPSREKLGAATLDLKTELGVSLL